MRYEVFYKNHTLDGRALRVRRTVEHTMEDLVADLAIVDAYLIEETGGLHLEHAEELFSDPVAQRCLQSPAADVLDIADWTHIIEICYRAGVTDPVALTAREAVAGVLGKDSVEELTIQTARQYVFKLRNSREDDLESLQELLHNPLIQRAMIIDRPGWDSRLRFPEIYSHTIPPSAMAVESISLSHLGSDGLAELSKRRLLALSVAEMSAVQHYFGDPDVTRTRMEVGLPAEATDVELEMIAQTWSEHCKHKILNARVSYTENGKTEVIDSLFSTYIKRTTHDLEECSTYLRSVFHDDSGVIEFDDETLVCFKVETHNSPSALDPYGGAITGIVGVNRDILGTGKGARPIFNTNVLCFGKPDTDPATIPAGLLHPRRVLSGVHHGIVDGGNQSGIPVVGGAFLFDESYSGKPLVFCGTGGILPASIGGEGSWIQHIDPGDLAVMVGGRIGKDGIHGATFSSLALDETSPTSAVQIGDPITQKKMTDLLMEARDRELYRGITDNGAGGLSSSLGEMAEHSNGIRVHLERCPLKYQGLAPWEILISESQERMSLAVSPDRIEAFLALAASRDVEATVIGEFTDSGFVEVFHGEEPVVHLSLDFLHDGLPVMELRAVWQAPERPEPVLALDHRDHTDKLLALLRDPNIASKEELIRQYDHEVQAQSIIKPFAGPNQDSPSDGAVLRPRRDSFRGLTVTHGVCPRYGDADTYHMAMCAVDEAFRAHIAMGGDPEYASALDNFCWPDPVASEHTPDGAYKMAQLVRACKGLRDACMAYGLPLISGKDSMKNDAVLDGMKVSVRPTLLVSLMGVMDDFRRSVNTDFRKPGDLIFVAGMTRGELGGSSYERLAGIAMGRCPEVEPVPALALYKAIHEAINDGLLSSCHDMSDGGIAVALAESALAGRVGIDVDLASIPVEPGKMEDERLLFCESPSRFVISVAPANRERFTRMTAGLPIAEIGVCTGTDRITIRTGENALIDTDLSSVESAWKGCDFA
jgi:phosphoribosylformylglycinamidine synthase subunit PurSL